MREPKSVTDLLTYRLLRLSNSLGLYSSRHHGDRFGVTLPEWRVMSILALHDTTTAQEISRTLATDKGWVGRSVEKLRRRGYVAASSDEEDNRKIILSLTEKGRQVHDGIMAVARKRQRRLLAALPDGAGDTLVECLDRLQVEADRMLEELDGQT